MIYLKIYQVINVKYPINAYRLTTFRVHEMVYNISEKSADRQSNQVSK